MQDVDASMKEIVKASEPSPQRAQTKQVIQLAASILGGALNASETRSPFMRNVSWQIRL